MLGTWLKKRVKSSCQVIEFHLLTLIITPPQRTDLLRFCRSVADDATIPSWLSAYRRSHLPQIFHFPRGYLRLASAIFLILAILINPVGRHPMIVVGLAGAASGIAMISLAMFDILKPHRQPAKNI